MIKRKNNYITISNCDKIYFSCIHASTGKSTFSVIHIAQIATSGKFTLCVSPVYHNR